MPKSGEIIEHTEMRQLLKLLSYNSLLLFDLDNTVIQSKIELGSDQWFVQLFSQAIESMEDKEKATASVIAIYNEVQKIVRAQAVEDITIWIIHTMQAIGIPVMAITARGYSLQPATVRQLSSVGLDFSKTIPKPLLGKLEICQTGELPSAAYKDGIIYCNGQDKGLCFKEFMAKTKYQPKHVVMVDDKLKHLERVKASVEATSIKFNGIRYAHLDQKASSIDMSEADKQLLFVKPRLSKSAQDDITYLKIETDTPIIGTAMNHFFYSKKASLSMDAQPPQEDYDEQAYPSHCASG